MIASRTNKGKTSVTRVLVCELYKPVLRTPPKVLEQCIELFGNLRGTIYFHGNHFCALIQEELENEIWQGCSS